MQIELPAESAQNLKPRKAKKMDKIMSSFTFVNACVGSGVLELGKIAKTAGFVPYFIYYAISISFCFFVFYIFSTACYHGNFPTISAAVRCLYGKVYMYVSDVSILFVNAGFLVSYISVSSDYLRDGIKNLGKVAVLGDKLWEYLFKLFVAVFIMCPLASLRKIDMINFISSFALIFVLVAGIGVTVRFVQYAKTGFTLIPPSYTSHPFPKEQIIPEDGYVTNTIAYFSMFFSLYSIHTNLAPLQREISGKPGERKRTVIFSYTLAIVITSLIYWWIGTLSAVMFDLNCEPDQVGCIKVDGNVLMIFGTEDMMMTIIKLLYSIVILVSYPCMLFPLRESLLIWFHIDKSTKLGYFYFCLIGWVITLAAMALSIAIPQIDKVFSLAANIFGVIIYELLAIFIWYKMPVLERHSFGAELEKVIDLVESTNDEESQNHVRGFVDRIEGSRLQAMSQQERAPREDCEAVERVDENFGERPARAVDAIEEIEAVVEQGVHQRGKKKEKYVDKFVLDGLEKEQFEHTKLRTVVWISSSIFFICFSIAAIVCEFV